MLFVKVLVSGAILPPAGRFSATNTSVFVKVLVSGAILPPMGRFVLKKNIIKSTNELYIL